MNIVTLIEELVNGLIAAEDIFFQNPKDFYSLEKSVKSTTEAFSAAFLGNVLTSMNEKIYEDRWRKTRYTAQRTDKRMLISSVGDITFESTYFRSKADGVHHYLLEEILGLDTRERFTEEAEVVLLTEAMKTSYSEATKVLPSRQEISKTSRASYYKWLHRGIPANEAKNKMIAEKIEKIHTESPDKGYRRIRDDLERYHGIKVNDKRVLRICRKKDIKSTIKYTNNGCTRQAANPQFVAENILNREFYADAPNEKWLTDVTEFKSFISRSSLFFLN